MKNKYFLLLTLFLALLFFVTSCATEQTTPPVDGETPNVEPVNLQIPENLGVEVLDGLVKITYSLVDNASFYRIYIVNEQNETVKMENLNGGHNTYTFYTKVLDSGNYEVYIKAVGDQTNYFDSAYTSRVSFEIKQEEIIDDPEPIMDYYKTTLGKVKDALKQELRTITKTTHKKVTTYAECKKYLQNSDEDQNNSNNMILFYTGESIKKTDNMDIWNREHVWAQSLGWFTTSKAGADLHHIRPCEPSVNSSRGNKKFGEGGSYYTPTDEYKGDVARIIFYLMVRYSEADKYSFTSIAQSLDVLIKWNELDPVSDHEKARNDYIMKIQGNRNPFIDYPEFARRIWK